ncbi:hypothetical protein TELCIR_10877, partial [Teladorsagia circumcincta]
MALPGITGSKKTYGCAIKWVGTGLIKDVSAMCSSEGITASIIFDGPFSGKIYSFDYAAVHDCIYYNGQDQDTMVDQMENRVYVQMELDAQTASDRQFLFVCQLAGTKANESSIRRHPSIPSLVSGGYAIASEAVEASQFQIRSNVPPVNGISAYPWNEPYAQSSLLSEATRAPLSQSFIANLSRTSDRLWRKAKIFKEGQGIGVEFQTDAGHKTIQSDNFATSSLLSSQELDSPAELSLEIQQGSGPFAPAVDSPIKIGDNITLVVRSKSRIRGNFLYEFLVFVLFTVETARKEVKNFVPLLGGT